MVRLYSGNKEANDILELDALSDAALKANFGYTDAGINNLRSDAKEIRELEKKGEIEL